MPRITGGLRITGGFSFGPTTGGATLPVLRWDTNYIGGGGILTLQNNNTFVVDQAPGDFTVLGTNAIPATGTYMYTVRLNFNYDAPADIGGYVGVATRNTNLNAYLGNDQYGFGFSDNGNVYIGDTQINTGFANFMSNDTIIDVAIKDRSLIWIRVNGGNWNDNASSNLLDGTGGLSLEGLVNADIYPAVNCAGTNGPTSFTLLPTAPFGVPSGVTFFNQYTPVSNTPTINISDLVDVTSGPITGNSYVNNGGWDYVVFTQPALYNAFVSLIGGTSFVPLAVQWAAGSDVINGYVFIEFSGNPNEFQFVTVTDSGASTPQAGTFNFPATFTLI